MELVHTTGFIGGLLAALSWAVASVIFRHLGVHLHPLILNLYKGVIAGVVLTFILLLRGALFIDVEFYPMALLLLSGILGIGVGDTAFFAALNRLGERQTVVIAETIAPMITVLIATLVFSEYLSFLALLGIAAIISGVFIVVREHSTNGTPKDRQHQKGMAYALIAAGCQAVGGILTKAAFRLVDLDPLWTALIRLLAGLAFLVVFIPFTKQSFFPLTFKNKKLWLYIFIASLIGTFGGLSFQQLAFKYTYTAIAQTLIATSSIMVLVIGFFLKEKISIRAWSGALIAVIGVGILFWFK